MNTYNKKQFLIPDGMFTMASYHAVIEPEGIAHFRISDCNKIIHLWNDLKEPEQKTEFIKKLRSLALGLFEFSTFIETNFK